MNRQEKSKQEAKNRVRLAIADMENATRFLEQAAQKLCQVRGTLPEWSRLTDLCQQIERESYAIQQKMNAGICELTPEALEKIIK
jgi:hypothetical protein